MNQQQLNQDLSRMQAAFKQQTYPTLQQRKYHLDQLLALILENQSAIIKAISEDFGHRSSHETQLIEIFPSIEGIRYALKHLKKWLKPQRRGVSIWHFGASNSVVAQPLGVIGVIVPWNYPLYLAIGPLTDALAAGNKAMIKMSELSPHLTKLLIDLMPQYLPDDVVSIYADDGDLGPLFSGLAFDHLVFTGSTNTGRKVMQAAAANLTPVTLELGGKSPVIIANDYPIKLAAERIMMGKLFNAGQTCVAPDYILLPKSQRQAFIDACLAYCKKHYSDLSDKSISSIISSDFLARLHEILGDAEQQGANTTPLIAGESSGKIAPTLIFDAPATTTLMQQEIFGPLLPVVEYEELAEAIAYVNQHEHPLALYVFSNQQQLQQQVIQQTQAGGVCINEVLLHVAQHELPFGGVGASGMGHYHGYDGFVQFSKMLPIFKQGRFAAISLMQPPYNKFTDLLIKLMTRG
ncbi:coniferyl aldehyde dehydrogenase [Agarivorans sp. 1_MG-2023]|uniref:coniferyl aldehyde dehydrogenase n=1 Tax=Agarivorans sp. 1_MG-2023 TaxID=3062634 RepID=UPI0026E1E26D|nr:coniferyl aldehyde dehydrogenase [Agarivorans sp. 1_MG-2023]MDO6765421.1 coniferyl aldehyde dehydrogenase [Agarivorans sp. 1_MG-2023]